MTSHAVLFSVGLLMLDVLALSLWALRQSKTDSCETRHLSNQVFKVRSDWSQKNLPGDKRGEKRGAISQRGQKNLAWFLRKHAGHVARIEAKQPPIDLMTAENWVMRDTLTALYKDYIGTSISTRSLSYADGLGGDPSLLEVSAKFFNQQFNPATAVEPRHIVTGAGCSAILDNLLFDICDSGDGVLVEVPFWGKSGLSQ